MAETRLTDGAGIAETSLTDEAGIAADVGNVTFVL